MKILWICNIVFPEAMSELTGVNEMKSSGGWMLGAANSLLEKQTSVELCVATVSPLVKELVRIQGKKIIYYILPKTTRGAYKAYEKLWQKVKAEFNPDIVHIHGTETRYGNDYLRTCGSKNAVVSIQGLISSCYEYYTAGMSTRDILSNLTVKDMLRGGVYKERSMFRKRGKYEIDTIKRITHIIGRTSWDRTMTWAINPKAIYHFCNETLRDEFYDGLHWNYEACDKHTIFLSQGGYPLKGLHQVLKAMPLIMEHYPDTKVRIAGMDITRCNNLKDFIRLGGYGRYIKKLIRLYGIQNNVSFIGRQSADGMKNEYLKANLFICPSSIENSPNSLGEAQILGVPCLASYVGGVMDLMEGNEGNMYRFEEYKTLAKKVCTIFSNKENQNDMRAIALQRHNKEENSNALYNIYVSILKGSH